MLLILLFTICRSRLVVTRYCYSILCCFHCQQLFWHKSHQCHKLFLHFFRISGSLQHHQCFLLGTTLTMYSFVERVSIFFPDHDGCCQWQQPLTPASSPKTSKKLHTDKTKHAPATHEFESPIQILFLQMPKASTNFTCQPMLNKWFPPCWKPMPHCPYSHLTKIQPITLLITFSSLW